MVCFYDILTLINQSNLFYYISSQNRFLLKLRRIQFRAVIFLSLWTLIQFFIPVTDTRKEKTKEASEWFSTQTQANKIPCRLISFFPLRHYHNPSFIPVTGTRKEKTKEASDRMEWFSTQTQANKIPCRLISFFPLRH